MDTKVKALMLVLSEQNRELNEVRKLYEQVSDDCMQLHHMHDVGHHGLFVLFYITLRTHTMIDCSLTREATIKYCNPEHGDYIFRKDIIRNML